MKIFTLLASIGLVCSAWSAHAADASAWPTKPVRLVVGFAAGGAADVLARGLLPELSKDLGQPVIVDNRPGATGNLGLAEAIRAPKDGYTLLLTPAETITTNPLLYKKLAFNPEKDLVPITSVARVDMHLEVHPKLGVQTIGDFLKLLKANPGTYAYGTPGQGSAPHLAGAMFGHLAGVDIQHIPYKGAAPALNDLLGGNLDFWFDPGPGLQHVDAGKLKLLAIGSPQRSKRFPQVPTLAESGLPQFQAYTLFGIYAPTGVPQAILERVKRSVDRAILSKDSLAVIDGLGATPVVMSRQAFVDHHAEEKARYGALVRQLHISAE